MFSSASSERRRRWREACLWTTSVVLLGLAGCASVFEPAVDPLPDNSTRRQTLELWEVRDPTDPAQPATQPVSPPPSATQPAGAEPDPVPDGSPNRPYRLNTESIVKLVYEASPLVASSRENMIAAQYGLEEFRANLSRLEPFARMDSQITHFPMRRNSDGVYAEAVGGIEKETFDGAIIRVEGGASGERVEFGDVTPDQDNVEKGSGGLVRARVEVPFVGSRKRQERVIAAAFQESSARAAVLSYLTNYRAYAENAIDYYVGTLLYLRYIRAYENKLRLLDELLADPRTPENNQLRIQSSAGDAKVLRDQYKAYYHNYLLLTLDAVGIPPGEEYVLQEPPLDAPLQYHDRTRTPEQRRQLLAEAYENNPKFRVLDDAIADAELKRSQAILGKNDVTAFAEGTQFPVGSRSFDDRVDGWEIGGGISFRRNDQRVLDATRKKAEAEIRQYRAQIEAEQLRVQRQVAVQSAVLSSYVASRPQIHENIAQAKTEFAERREAYLGNESASLTIDDVLTPLGALTTAEVRLAGNVYYAALAENALLVATGEVYRMVGMKMVDGGNGIQLPEDE